MTADDHARRAERRVGTIVNGKYRIERVLGVGGMAVVYLATSRLEKRVAIKFLHPELSIDQDCRSRFLLEGVAANTVGHPGAVAVLDDDTAEDGAPFLVMELLDGASLQALVEKRGTPLPLEAVLAIAYQVLDVLGAAHPKGVVHRDIKPENLFLTSDGAVKVLDFGIARVRDHVRARATATGSVFGTPMFMAPEQARGQTREIDAQSDLWAVGATIFTLLTGHYVHDGESAQAVILRAATVPAAPLRSVLPDAPAPVCDLVDRALVDAKASRWASANAMAQAVRQAQTTIFGRVSVPPRPRELLEDAPDPLAPTVAVVPASPRGAAATGVPATVEGAPFAARPVVAATSRVLPAMEFTARTPPAVAVSSSPALRNEGVRPPRSPRRMVVASLAAGATVLAVAAAIGAREKWSSAPAAIGSAAGTAPAVSATTCDGEPRAPLDCSAGVVAGLLPLADADGAASNAGPAADRHQTAAWQQIDRQRSVLASELRQLCDAYNKCVVDKATYVLRSDELRRRIDEVPALLDVVRNAPSDDARRAALGVAYRKVVPEEARTELHLEFSALARRPGEAAMTSAGPGDSIPTGSQLAFTVGVSRQAYLYIFEKSTSGSIHVSFPDSRISVSNPLAAGAVLRIPQGGAFFRLDDKDLGVESVYLWASLHPIATIADAVADPGRAAHGASPTLARATAIDGNCPRHRGLSFEEESPNSSGCLPTRGLSFEAERAAPSAPSLATVTEAADDTIATVYRFNHTP